VCVWLPDLNKTDGWIILIDTLQHTVCIEPTFIRGQGSARGASAPSAAQEIYKFVQQK